MTGEGVEIKVAAALAGRMDRLESARRDDREKIEVLDRAVRGVLAGAVKSGAAGTAKGRADDDASPPVDWITLDDPDLAEVTLVALDGWVSRYMPVMTHKVRGCWPWHPAAVVELLALADLWAHAYGQDGTAVRVGDFVGRWLPDGVKRIGTELGACDDYSHRHDGAYWSVHRESLPDLARWWVARGQAPPPGLTLRP